jgi:hypothetical protein
MRIVLNKHIPFGSFAAMCIGPWIFVKDINKVTTTLITHEAIHWEQQKELAVIFFYLIYATMFIVELVRCLFDSSRGSRADGRHRPLWKRAYRCIQFEREAYEMESFQGYIGARKHYAWLITSVKSEK